MKKIIFSAAILIFWSFLSQAQYASNIDFSAGFGFETLSPKQLPLSQYQTLFPESELLKIDYQGFNEDPLYFNYNSDVLLNLLWGFKIGQGSKLEQVLRFGVTYSGTTVYSNSFKKTITIPYDTLNSTRTGNQTFIDSVYKEYTTINVSQERIGLDVSYIIKSNPSNRLVFYSGGGAVLGLSVNARASIKQNSYSYFATVDDDYYQNRARSNDDNKSEVFNLSNNFWAQLYVPIGLDFRLSNVNPFWQRMHIYSELRPNMQLVLIEGFDPSIDLSFGWAVFGSRFEF